MQATVTDSDTDTYTSPTISPNSAFVEGDLLRRGNAWYRYNQANWSFELVCPDEEA